MVPEADKAWHVGVANSYTIGIEHEAYGNIYSYFTMNMYQSSADLVKNICSRRSNINPHRVFYRDTLDDGTVLNDGVHADSRPPALSEPDAHRPGAVLELESLLQAHQRQPDGDHRYVGNRNFHRLWRSGE